MPEPHYENTAYANWSLGSFERLKDVNPILGPGGATFDCPFLGNVKWDALGIFNPAVVVKDDQVFCVYRAAGWDGFVTGVSRQRPPCVGVSTLTLREPNFNHSPAWLRQGCRYPWCLRIFWRQPKKL